MTVEMKRGRSERVELDCVSCFRVRSYVSNYVVLAHTGVLMERLRMIYMQRLEALQAEIQRLENQQVEMQQRPLVQQKNQSEREREREKKKCAVRGVPPQRCPSDYPFGSLLGRFWGGFGPKLRLQDFHGEHDRLLELQKVPAQ